MSAKLSSHTSRLHLPSSTRGLNLPGSLIPSHLPLTHSWVQPVGPSSIHQTTAHITALPTYTNGEMTARFSLHTGAHRPLPRRRPPLPPMPLAVPRAHPARIPLLVFPPPRQRTRQMLLSKSKNLASKIPAAFMAVTAPFLTEMVVRYTWGDKYCYIFPFWI
ncbi:hypothetical protein BJX66DRAFT_338359 [Aspergillus keveii]|uniref:Uncharacterized protein n=1 Tax=Aspergillus keveii TaxID=714993 RepID=A0ABR4G4I7_9EURO